MPNWENEKTSMAEFAEPPLPRSMLTRDELEFVLNAVLTDWRLLEPRQGIDFDSKSSGNINEDSLPLPLSPLSQDELERILTVVAGDRWKLQN